MRIAVIGVGGIGGFFGGLLARAHEQVTFVARGEQFSVLREKGLKVFSVQGDFEITRVDVVDCISKLARPELVLIATKAYDLEDVARQLPRVLHPEAIIIPLQNGIDSAERVKSILGEAQVHPGLCYVISARTAPGVIEQTAGPRTLIFGDRDNPSNSALKNIECMMKEAGILATCAADIDCELWTKFLWITTFSGITSVTRSAIGPIVNDPDTFQWYINCLDEGLSVARALEINLPSQIREQLIAKSEHYRTEGMNAKSSMLVDLENGRRTEIESLNGAMVGLARKCGVSVPIHESIYHAIRYGDFSPVVNEDG